MLGLINLNCYKSNNKNAMIIKAGRKLPVSTSHAPLLGRQAAQQPYRRVAYLQGAPGLPAAAPEAHPSNCCGSQCTLLHCVHLSITSHVPRWLPWQPPGCAQHTVCSREAVKATVRSDSAAISNQHRSPHSGRVNPPCV